MMIILCQLLIISGWLIVFKYIFKTYFENLSKPTMQNITIPRKFPIKMKINENNQAWTFLTHIHHNHCIFVFLEDIMQSNVFIQAFLSSQIFSRLSRSFSWPPDRLMLEYLEMSFRIILSHVVFGLPTDLYRS